MNLPLDPVLLGHLCQEKPPRDTALLDSLGCLPDFRLSRSRRHNLIDIVFIAVCATISDCNTWEEVREYGLDKQSWLATLLELPNGIPSHDTFNRVFRLLDPVALQDCLLDWLTTPRCDAEGSTAGSSSNDSQPPKHEPPKQTNPTAEKHPKGTPEQPEEEPASPKRHQAVDGKTLRHSFDTLGQQSALHLVSVWDCEQGITLAQVPVDSKSNEITAIPKALALVDLEGALVSIDAIGTQEEIVKQIRAGKGDYLLAVKENQLTLYKEVVNTFARYFEQLTDKPDVKEYVTLDKNLHGRRDKRTYVVSTDVSGISDQEKWQDVATLVMVHRESCKADGSLEEETRFFIGSAKASKEQYAKWVRNHWSIENQLHWVLDDTFAEDASRIRKERGPENLALLRRVAVSLLGNEKTCKRSIRGKRKKAARNNDYLLRILLGPDASDRPD
jgi:predicted transposase YbfD/YdcC